MASGPDDEFAVLVEPVEEEASVAVPADRLIAAVSRPVVLDINAAHVAATAARTEEGARPAVR